MHKKMQLTGTNTQKVTGTSCKNAAGSDREKQARNNGLCVDAADRKKHTASKDINDKIAACSDRNTY